MLCNIQDPLTKEDYSRDPRNVARKAVNYMKSTGVADTAFFGPSLEFFVFDDVKYDQTAHSAFYYVDSAEAQWNTGRDERPNLGHKIPYKQGYFPCPPTDAMHGHIRRVTLEHYIARQRVTAIFDPPELAEALAFRQSIPPDLMSLLRAWAVGFCPLNTIESSLSDLIDKRRSNPVQRTAGAVTAEDAMSLAVYFVAA